METSNQQTPMRTVWGFVLGTMVLTLSGVASWHIWLVQAYQHARSAEVAIAEEEISELLRYRDIVQSGGKDAGELYVSLRKGASATTTP